MPKTFFSTLLTCANRRVKKEAEMYWSLRNKTEDIERALARGDTAHARMAAHELGVRLSHHTAAEQLRKGEIDKDEQTGGHHTLIARVLFQFEQDLSMLFSLLKNGNTSRAAEVVQMLFSHLGALDWSLTFGPTSIMRNEDEEWP